MTPEVDLLSRLKILRTSLESTIIGQPDAIAEIMGAIERYQAGLHDNKRPIGTFLFLGPTGTGKSWSVESFANLIHTPDAFIRIDCSEYSLDHEVAKLLGSPPGYTGHEQGSWLSKAIEGLKHPENGFILLLDEIEKAHPKFFDIWLQVMDAGRMTDAKGNKLDFTKSIIFFTSNIGAKNYSDNQSIGFRPDKTTDKNVENAVLAEVKKSFRPEFINRLSGKVFFSPLTEEQEAIILDNLISDLNSRLEKYYIKVKIGPALLNKIKKAGFSKEYGAREIKRSLIKHLEQPLAHKIIERSIPEDSFFVLDLVDDIFVATRLGDFPILALEEAVNS